MKRSPLQRRTPLRGKGGRLRATSTVREAQRDEYAACVANVVRRDGLRCRASGVALTCRGRLDPHHVLPVGRGGARCDPANILILCRAHHDWAHGNPIDAGKLGFIASSHA